MAVNISQREGLLPTGRDGERILCVMPLFHTYALAMGLHLAAYCGGTLVILPRYHPQDVLRVLVEEGITIFPGSPTIFSGLMAHADFGRDGFLARAYLLFRLGAAAGGDAEALGGSDRLRDP